MPLDAEQEWNKELTRILGVRQRELQRPMKWLKKANKVYRKQAVALRSKSDELVELRRRSTPDHSADRESVDATVLKSRYKDVHWLLRTREFAESVGKEQQTAIRKLLTDADTLALHGNHEQLRDKLNELDDALAEFGPLDQALIPPSETDIRRALAREDLFQHVARNDTWANFNIDKALRGESEEDQKVLLNIIDSALLAQRSDDQWNQFTAAVSEKAREANRATTSGEQTAAEGGYDRSRSLEEQASPETVYKLAILGAAASAAYYIANADVDLQNTVIIGEKDPWAGERGGDEDAVINHPHNMIDPEGAPDFEGGLAKRSEFAKRVKKIIDRAPHQCDGRIAKVKKEKVTDADDQTHAYYRIETNKGVYFAQKVISALGIGPQINRFEPNWEPSKDEVCDMDTFMREIDERIGDKTRDYTIGVSGGNAAIDIVTAIVRKSDAKIIWCHGSSARPQFLEGTDNDVAAKAFDEGGPSSQVTPKRGYWNVQKTNRQIEMVLDDERIPVDQVVYGVGPDTSVIAELFDESCNEPDEEPAPYDLNQHFQLSLFEKRPGEVVKNLGTKLKFENPRALEELGALLEDPSLEGEKRIGDPPAPKLGGASSAGAGLEFIGGQETRQVTEESARRHGKNVTSSLPDNVAIGDQLTPSRARIEASTDAMPLDENDVPLVMEEGGVNFITANQTVIATHIACCYPNIPEEVANYLTAQIVVARSREKMTPLPKRPAEGGEHSLEDQQRFQDDWVRRLRKFQMECARARPVTV